MALAELFRSNAIAESPIVRIARSIKSYVSILSRENGSSGGRKWIQPRDLGKSTKITCFPSAYKDMAQRLEKMERLISDFAIEPKSLTDSTSPRSVSEGSPSDDLPKDKPVKRSPAAILESIEDSDFGWAANGVKFEPLEEGASREPYRGDRFVPHLLDGEDSGYNGIVIPSCQMAYFISIADPYRNLYILAFRRSICQSSSWRSEF